MSNQTRLAAAVLAGVFSIVSCYRAGAEVSVPDQSSASVSAETRFQPLYIALEVGEEPVAAYQLELKLLAGDAEIVGVEGGDATGFTDPPFYDPAALTGGRIILAALSLEASLPKGRHHVATVHMRESGPPPTYQLRVITAGSSDARAVKITAVLVNDSPRSPWEEP